MFTMIYLGKTLSQENIVTIINKLPESSSVLVNITRGKPLIGHVKVRQEILLLDEGRHFLPLLRSWVHTSRVVSTGV